MTVQRFTIAMPTRQPRAPSLSATRSLRHLLLPMTGGCIAPRTKLWEYPGADVPLIVQPFPEMRRIVEGYRCGWLLPAELTPAAIAGVVASLTDEMIAAARVGCRRFVEEDNWPAVYRSRLLDLYGNIERCATSIRTETAEAAG